jgi:hypothetical protein
MDDVGDRDQQLIDVRQPAHKRVRHGGCLLAFPARKRPPKWRPK